MERQLVGKVLHFYPKIGVAVVELSGPLKVGDRIAVEGREPFEQAVSSMQVEHAAVPAASAGQSVGLKVEGRAHEGDLVYRLA
ncbi:MAG: translation elongation factor-like protein [Candidatus Micrarchaeota archaeon]